MHRRLSPIWGLTVARPVVGYTAGVFDLFHVGHLRLLRQARSRCDFLIVGVTTDSLAAQTKGHLPAVPAIERMDIVQSVRYVDQVVTQDTMDKVRAWRSLRFDVVYVGDNLKGTESWRRMEQQLMEVDVAVEYLPHTRSHSRYLVERGRHDQEGS
jgi:glycerol-3-phosphate cytidylyltransferase